MTPSEPRDFLKAILGLSSGTVIARALSAVSQILLVIWLPPSEFGIWAAANATLAFVAGLTNFGEVNGYLSGNGSGFARTRRNIAHLNLALTACGLLFAAVYLITGNAAVAILALVIAITIPFTGHGDLLYSTNVKLGRYRPAVFSQVVGALAKLGVGVIVAVLTQSAIAIALSVLASSLAVNFLLRRTSRFVPEESSGVDQKPIAARQRFAWAVNSWMMTVPLQAGFFVAQFVASSALVGLYYLSYQITLAISGVLSGPLARVALSALGETAPDKRARVAADLSHTLGASMLVFAAVGSSIAPLVSPWVTTEWQSALPATAILLASLPARIMSPVVDAFQQANDRWWRSTAFNVCDAIGTGASALVLLTGDLIPFVICLTAWKSLFCLTRMVSTFGGVRVYSLFAAIPTLAGSCLIVVAAVSGGTLGAVLNGAAALLGALWLLSIRRWNDRNRRIPNGDR